MPDDPQDAPVDLPAEVVRTLYAMLRQRGHEVKEAEAFKYSFGGPFGHADMYFYHEKLAQWALETTDDICKKIFDEAATKLNLEVTRIEADDDFKISIAALISYFIVEGMLGKFSSAFQELGYEAKQIFKGIVVSEVKRGSLPVPDASELIDDWSKKMIASRKQFLRNVISAYTSPHRHLLKAQYDALLPVWQKAKKIYKSYKDMPTWKKMIVAAFPEYGLPEDLVSLLSGDLDDLSEMAEPMRERILKVTERGEDYSRASSLALEHAARLCRYEPFQHGPTILFRHMKREQVADSEAQSDSLHESQQRRLPPSKKKSADKKVSLTHSVSKRVSKKK
jgi:hypothetical protein